ncbi:MAG: RT0821/Lpp0805 family surface protein [Kiloniellaceae bacterium]
MKIKTVIAAAAIALMAAACTQDGRYGTKQTIGALGGAAAGGLLGAQVGKGSGKLAATAAGALLGALIGSEIGRTMDEVDRMKAQQAYTQATTAPIGQQITWQNPDTGNYGTVTPTREGTTPTGEYCREFQQTVVIGGKTEDAYGIACRRPDGSWEIQ